MLIVDDDVRNIFALTSVLEGPRHGGASSPRTGRTAIDDARSSNPEIDLVLMDIMMPEMDGYETMRAIRADAGVQVAADHRADGEGDEGRPREVHRSRARPTTSRSRWTPTSCFRLMRVWLYR